MANAADTDVSIPYSLRQLPADYNYNNTGVVDIFDTTNLGAPATPYDGTMTSVWESLANPISETWDGAKQTVSDVVSSVTSGIGDGVSSLTDKLQSIIGSGIFYLVLILGAVVVGIYFIGKSGAIGQGASLAGALKG